MSRVDVVAAERARLGELLARCRTAQQVYAKNPAARSLVNAQVRRILDALRDLDVGDSARSESRTPATRASE